MLIKHKIKSSDDSIKYILETEDHHLFECIYMPHDVDDAVVMCRILRFKSANSFIL